MIFLSVSHIKAIFLVGGSAMRWLEFHQDLAFERVLYRY
jgi:hypothetical protein